MEDERFFQVFSDARVDDLSVMLRRHGLAPGTETAPIKSRDDAHAAVFDGTPPLDVCA